MGNYWRSGEGREVIETAARWVVEQAAFRGLTVHDYIGGLCSLVDMGVTSENAVATLKPRIGTAHDHYNEHGGSKQKFGTWEKWFSNRLRNRIFYFFHKHDSAGKIVRCVAEWPLPLPESPRHFNTVPTDANGKPVVPYSEMEVVFAAAFAEVLEEEAA